MCSRTRRGREVESASDSLHVTTVMLVTLAQFPTGHGGLLALVSLSQRRDLYASKRSDLQPASRANI